MGSGSGGRPKTRALLITDDVQLAKLLASIVEGHWPSSSCEVVLRQKDAVASIQAHASDVVIADGDMAGEAGMRAVEAIREISSVPAVVLSTREDEASVVSAIERGADLYATRPFDVGVLVARLKSLLRRTVGGAPGWQALMRFGELAIDSENGTVHVGDTLVRLTPTERRLLSYLARNAGKVSTRDALSTMVWQGDRSASAANLKVFISRLRSKIEPENGPKLIHTERGLGYKFVPPEQEPGETRST